MSTEITQPNVLALRDAAPFEAVDHLLAEYRGKVGDLKSDMLKMAYTAKAIGALRKMLPDELVKGFKSLENTALGFKTDKKDGGYDIETIRECLIQSLIRDIKTVGNEFNIIGGNFYITKEGFQGMMRRDRRFTEVRIKYGVPAIDEKGLRAVVKFSATWKYNGKADLIDGDEVPVKWNKYSSDDQILGKAERKIRARIWNQATGDNAPDGEADIVDIDPAGKPSAGALFGAKKDPVPVAATVTDANPPAGDGAPSFGGEGETKA